MNEVKKCPKCGSEMKREDKLTGYGFIAVKSAPKSSEGRDKIVPFYCPNCGYVELYNEVYLREQ